MRRLRKRYKGKGEKECLRRTYIKKIERCQGRSSGEVIEKETSTVKRLMIRLEKLKKGEKMTNKRISMGVA